MSQQFQSLIENRRTIYHIGKNVQLSTQDLTHLIENAIEHAPSAFNSQTSRAVILFHAEHEAFWTLAFDQLKQFLPDDEAKERTQAKLNSFSAGIATILFFEDTDVVKGLQTQFPLYADNFPVWSEHSTGIAQFAVWTALAEQGLGASLQHYNPVVEDAVQQKWGVPSNWKLRAQLVFGSVESGAAEKTFIDRATRFKVFGS